MRALDGAVFFATCCAVGLFIILMVVRGAGYFEGSVLPWLLDMSGILAIGVVACWALYLVGAARLALPLYLSPVSILLGFTAWTYAFALTERFTGPAGLVIGFSLGGLPIFPIGLGAALLSHEFLAAMVVTAVGMSAAGARALSEKCAGKESNN